MYVHSACSYCRLYLVDVPLDLRAPMRADTAENALQTLRKYDTVLIIDDSGSMLGSKWRQVSTINLP